MYGVPQALNAVALFRRHSKLASGSSLAKVKLARVFAVVRSGPDSIAVVGGLRSGGAGLTVQEIAAGTGSAWPRRSIARTSNV